MSVTNLYTYRGEIRGLVAIGDALAFCTVHDEGQPTALYQIDLEKQRMQVSPLVGGGLGLVVSEDKRVYVAGSDGQIYQRGWKSGDFEPLGKPLPGPAAALTMLREGRLAVICGDALLVIAIQDGALVQRLPLPEPGTSIASDPSGAWLAVGCARGTLAIFDGETQLELVATEHKQIHEGAVTTLLFERDELRVLSGGSDAKIYLTHVRGVLEPELRSGRSGHGDALTCLVHGPGNRTYSGARDRVIKIWTQGQGRSSTVKGRGPAVAMVVVEYKARPHLAVAFEDASFGIYAIDAKGKLGDLELLLKGAAAWAKNERKERDPKVREKSLRKIAGWNDSIAIEHLGWAAANDSDHALKTLATELLGASGNPRALKPLGSLLRASEEAVRLAALAGLRRLEGETSLRPLRLALSAGHRDIGVVAIQALVVLAKGDDIALDRLIEALSEDPSEVRVAALLALETLYPRTSTQAVLLGLRSTKSDIRRLALLRSWQRSLVSDPEVLTALRRFAADPDADVRKTAFQVSLLARPKLAAALRAADSQLHRQLHGIESASTPSFDLEVKSSIK
ncbi:MAG TPA: hypothetical protein ENJ18_06045, partial [Nannocystis exedens]|nr:hypothetical protein [Nannocystis exedens]